MGRSNVEMTACAQMINEDIKSKTILRTLVIRDTLWVIRRGFSVIPNAVMVIRNAVWSYGKGLGTLLLKKLGGGDFDLRILDAEC